jgi:uncharacterized iron-regulated membrane protein
MPRGRQFWVAIHRWAGLTIALFLIVVGGTGSLLAFYPELERVVAPQFMLAPGDGLRLDPLVLRERAEALSGGRADFVPLHVAPGDAAIMQVEAWPGHAALDYDELALDPATGAELGRRTWGDIGEGTVNLMPFLYRLHYSLAAGEWGSWALGIAAFVWTIDCFVGWALTLPARRPFLWRRWRKAWSVRTDNAPKLTFDLHRAGGLWLWPILLIFAWSSVGFNLQPVYSPVMQAVLGNAEPANGARAVPVETPALDWHAARERARTLAAERGRIEGFSVTREEWLRLDRAEGAYIFAFQSDRDVYARFVGGRLVFDANTGALRSLKLPTGQHARTTVETWLSGLHMGVVLGLPWRIAVCLVGLAVMMLSVTGVLIWMRKRSAALLVHHRHGRRSKSGITRGKPAPSCAG